MFLPSLPFADTGAGRRKEGRVRTFMKVGSGVRWDVQRPSGGGREDVKGEIAEKEETVAGTFLKDVEV